MSCEKHLIFRTTEVRSLSPAVESDTAHRTRKVFRTRQGLAKHLIPGPRGGHQEQRVVKAHASRQRVSGERSILLVRHGELDLHAFSKDQFGADLTDLGREQARLT